MKVRRATADDAAAIAALFVQLKEHHVGLAPGLPRYELPDEDWAAHTDALLTDPNKRIYIAEQGPQVVGSAVVYFEEKPWGTACEVETLVVDEETRDQGVGTSLMNRIEEVARAEGALAMRVNVLHSNKQGRRFYERDGYRTIAVRYGKPL